MGWNGVRTTAPEMQTKAVCYTYYGNESKGVRTKQKKTGEKTPKEYNLILCKDERARL